jgi:hypothetical protein
VIAEDDLILREQVIELTPVAVEDTAVEVVLRSHLLGQAGNPLPLGALREPVGNDHHGYAL